MKSLRTRRLSCFGAFELSAQFALLVLVVNLVVVLEVAPVHAQQIAQPNRTQQVAQPPVEQQPTRMPTALQPLAPKLQAIAPKMAPVVPEPAQPSIVRTERPTEESTRPRALAEALPRGPIEIKKTPGARASDAPLDSPIIEKPITLSPDSIQLGEQMGLTEDIRRVDELRSQSDANQSLELVQRKQSIMQHVLVAMLQVRAASAQISLDIFEAGQTSVALESRRDRALRYNSIANFVSGGLGELLGGAFQLVPRVPLDNTGNIIEMTGGVAQTGLSTVALKQANGAKVRMAVKPNMLAPIFDQGTNHESKYPRIVWRYLNEPQANGESRRSALVKQWLQSGRLEGRQAQLIAALTGNGGKQIPITIDILQDRMAMLSDVTAQVSRIERLLLEILLYSDVQNAI